MRRAAQALLAILFAICVYRAFTQSLVHDEALTYEWYVKSPLDKVFHSYTANHHFLNSILERISAAIFGDSELALRLPALGGAALYFVATYRLALLAFGESIFFFLAVALLSLNPFVLDFMVAARGYGMALALLMYALALLLETFGPKQISPKKLAWAGACIALSPTANLVFMLPAAALAGLAFISVYNRSRPQPAPAGNREKRRKQAKKQQADPAYWTWFLAPIVVIAVLFIVLAPIDAIRLDDLYTGAATISESLRSLATVALLHSGPLRKMDAMNFIRDLTAFLLAPLIVTAAFAAGIVRRNLVLLWASVPLVFASAVLVVSHVALGRPYPADRTGIYFAPLVCLSLIALAYWAKDVSKFASATLGGLSALLILCFLTEFNVRKFWVWEYDADSRTIAYYIASHRDPSADNVRVGGSWELTESMYYYLIRNRWEWMQIERRPPEPGYSYYALLPKDDSVIKTLQLKVVYIGPVSGSILAVPAGR